MTANATLPVLLGTGIHADRPAAADVGSGGLYSCTTHSLVYQTDGSSWTTWATLGGGGGTVTSAVLTTGDVTLPQNTWTDILSLSLAAGTYVIMAMANLQSVTGAQDVDIRIQNTTDTATLASGAASITATSFDWTVSIVTTVVLGGTKTVKLQGNAGGASGGKALQAIQSNGTGNNAVQIVALKIA